MDLYDTLFNLLIDKKAGRFITKDGRVIFIGGPGSGGGSATSTPASLVSAIAKAESNSEIYALAKNAEEAMRAEANALGIKDEFSILLGDNTLHGSRNWSTRDVSKEEAASLEKAGFVVDGGKLYYEKNPPDWMPDTLKGKILSEHFVQSMGIRSYFQEPPNREAKLNFVKSLNGEYGPEYQRAAKIMHDMSQSVFNERYGATGTLYRAGDIGKIMSVSEHSSSASYAGSIVGGNQRTALPVNVTINNVLLSHRVIQTIYPEMEWIIMGE